VDAFIQGDEYKTALKVFGEETAAQLCFAAIGGSWYDMFYRADNDPEWDAVMTKYCATKQAREAEEARKLAAYRQRQIEEKVAEEARRNLKKGQAVQKNGRVCTRCYSCEGDKHTDWEDGGKKARPSTLGVSSECFTHREFLAGRIREDCPFLHQGDAGWHAQWSKNFLWDPSNPQVMMQSAVRMVRGQPLSMGWMMVRRVAGRNSTRAAARDAWRLSSVA
jgi:hypothetical protein